MENEDLELQLALLQIRQMEETVVHYGITCGHCELNPIIGPRFQTDGYDLCHTCFEDLGEAGSNFKRHDQASLLHLVGETPLFSPYDHVPTNSSLFSREFSGMAAIASRFPLESFFNIQARYVIECMDPDQWAIALSPHNTYQSCILEEIINLLPENTNFQQVSMAVKAFMTINLHADLIRLLERMLPLQSSIVGRLNLEDVLILAAITVNRSKVKELIIMLDKYSPFIGDVAVKAELYEEAFLVFCKFQLHKEAVNVLLDGLKDIERAVAFAEDLSEPDVWDQVTQAQTRRICMSINSVTRAKDISEFKDIVLTAKNHSCFEDLIEYLLMAREISVTAEVDEELIYAYAKLEKFGEIEELISKANIAANFQRISDRLFDEELHKAGRIVLTYSNRTMQARAGTSRPQEEEEDCCCICVEHPKDAALVPCGHRMCQGCGNTIFHSERKKCPICAQTIEKLVILYG